MWGQTECPQMTLYNRCIQKLQFTLTVSSLANISFGTMNNGFNKKLHIINSDLCLAPELLTHCEFEERVEEGMR